MKILNAFFIVLLFLVLINGVFAVPTTTTNASTTWTTTDSITVTCTDTYGCFETQYTLGGETKLNNYIFKDSYSFGENVSSVFSYGTYAYVSGPAGTDIYTIDGEQGMDNVHREIITALGL